MTDIQLQFRAPGYRINIIKEHFINDAIGKQKKNDWFEYKAWAAAGRCHLFSYRPGIPQHLLADTALPVHKL
jgi:hypothetical protein